MADMTNGPAMGRRAPARGSFSAPRRDFGATDPRRGPAPAEPRQEPAGVSRTRDTDMGAPHRDYERGAHQRDYDTSVPRRAPVPEPQHYQEAAEVPLAVRLRALTHYSGAIVSVALLIGMGVWGYKLVVRDVTGIPVVQAALGPMREAPADPGGNLALNTGLAVNDIAALGQAGDPEDRLMLAPATADLTEEDLLVQPTAEMGEVMPAGFADDTLTVTTLGDEAAFPASGAPALTDPATPGQPMTADDILAFADQIAAGTVPLTDLAEGADVPVALSLEGADAVTGALNEVLTEAATATGAISTSIAGVTTAYRPPARPAGLQTASVAPVAATAPAVAPVAAAAIPAGATLVQLGAFETPEIAAAEWATLAGRFGEFMVGKERVVQAATSGGREFYRLRAMGFADFDDANRFCAALVAEGALCIPVAGG